MRINNSILAIFLCLFSYVFAGKLKIGTIKKVEDCTRRASNGDKLSVHYEGYVLTDDGENPDAFDSSYKREEPLSFVLGGKQVIPGWEKGILGMCVGEKRKLVIPPELAYGDRGAGNVIPPKSTLIFYTELVSIDSESEDDHDHEDL